MAINQKRPDTPLAATPEAKIDPPIKRTQTTNPDGSVTYRQSWSGSSSGSNSNSSTRRTTTAASKGAPAKSSSYKTATSGSREITSAPIPKAAGSKKTEISAPLMKKENKFVPKTQKEKVIEKKIQDYNKNKSSDETYDQYRKKTQDRANINSEKAKSSSGGKRVFAPTFDCKC